MTTSPDVSETKVDAQVESELSVAKVGTQSDEAQKDNAGVSEPVKTTAKRKRATAVKTSEQKGSAENAPTPKVTNPSSSNPKATKGSEPQKTMQPEKKDSQESLTPRNVNQPNHQSSNALTPNQFTQKVFEDSSEALSRALVRKEQKALLFTELDPDVPVKHSKESKVPAKIMKLPKVPPETRPGRAAMFGNIPLDPVKYEPRHKSEDYSKAYLKESVHLDSDQAQRLFENCYDDINISFSILATVYRRFDPKGFLETEKKFVSDLSRIQEHFRQGINDVAVSLNECVKEENRRVAFHDHEREYVVPINTPYSLRFVTCLTLYDRYVSRLNAALITGIIDYDGFDECLKSSGDVLQKFRKDVILLRHRLMKELRSKSGEKAEVKKAEQIAQRSIMGDVIQTDDPHPDSHEKRFLGKSV